MSKPTIPIPREAWYWLDMLLTRLNDGTLTTAEIPPMVDTHEHSARLDEIEEQLFSADARSGEPPSRIEADRAALRLARYLARDEPSELARLVRLFPDDASANGWRIRTMLAAVNEAMEPTDSVH